MTRVAVVQLDADVGADSDLGAGAGAERARASAVEAVGAAAGRGAALVVLPEYAGGWLPAPDPALAEERDGPFATALRAAAARARATVVAGFVAAGPDGRGVNLALAAGPDGAVLGTYAKVHLFDAFGWRESDALVGGEPTAPPLVVDVDGLAVGVLTCYDLRFPESARRLVDAGAQVLVVIAAWASGPGKAAQLRVLARARAIENTCYLLLASQCGPGRTGHSAVVDPFGVVVAEAPGEGDAVLVAELDPALVARARAVVPVLEHRRYRVVPAP